MHNAQLKPGYNINITSDSEYIVSADIFQNRNDVRILIFFIKRGDKNLEESKETNGCTFPKAFKKCQEAYKNILIEKSILYRINRSIQAEDKFRILKNRLQIPKISTSWDVQNKIGDSFTQYGI